MRTLNAIIAGALSLAAGCSGSRDFIDKYDPWGGTQAKSAGLEQKSYFEWDAGRVQQHFDVEIALQRLEQLSEEAASDEFYTKRGRAALGRDRYNDAINDFSTAIRLRESRTDISKSKNVTSELYFPAGDIYLARGRALCRKAEALKKMGVSPFFEYERAIENLTKSFETYLESDPESADIFKLRADCYSEIGEYEKAEADMRAFRRLSGLPEEKASPPAQIEVLVPPPFKFDDVYPVKKKNSVKPSFDFDFKKQFGLTLEKILSFFRW